MMKLNKEEVLELREVLRISIGNYADRLSDENLNELGTSMLKATAIALKAKYSNRRVPLED